jgi:hypothetical protein
LGSVVSVHAPGEAGETGLAQDLAGLQKSPPVWAWLVARFFCPGGGRFLLRDFLSDGGFDHGAWSTPSG